MSRIPYPPLDQLSPVKHQRIFAPGRKYVLNVQKMILHTPDELWAAQADLGLAVISKTGLDPRSRELCVLRVAALEQSEYELYHHRAIASHAGATEAEIAAAEAGDLSQFPPPLQALLTFVTEVTRSISPGDETLAQAREHYSDSVIYAVIALIGSYMMTARFAAVGGVEPDEAPVSTW